jgi:hypothetical protein
VTFKEFHDICRAMSYSYEFSYCYETDRFEIQVTRPKQKRLLIRWSKGLDTGLEGLRKEDLCL